MTRVLALLAPLVIAAASGCAGQRPSYDPAVTVADFVAGITNPFFPLRPGSTWVYEAPLGDGVERVDVEVLAETRRIVGVEATVVRDTVSRNGETIEDTYDWYGQDKNGNVWYLGESTKEYADGRVASTEGSWEWGVDGALPGIVMPADPRPDGKRYFQEFYWGEAGDEAEVIALGRPVATSAGRFNDTVTMREWTRLEPGIEEEAYYARGVGLVSKEATKGPGQGAREALTAFWIP